MAPTPWPMRTHTTDMAAAVDVATRTAVTGTETSTGRREATMTGVAVMAALLATAAVTHLSGRTDGIGAVVPADTGTGGTMTLVIALGVGIGRTGIGSRSRTGGRECVRVKVTAVAWSAGTRNGAGSVWSVAAAVVQGTYGRGMGCRTRTCRSTLGRGCAMTLS